MLNISVALGKKKAFVIFKLKESPEIYTKNNVISSSMFKLKITIADKK
jgi:hypothetical protein